MTPRLPATEHPPYFLIGYKLHDGRYAIQVSVDSHGDPQKQGPWEIVEVAEFAARMEAARQAAEEMTG